MHLQPSTHDKAITRQFQEAGKLLENQMLEHLILCRNGYYSFAEEVLAALIPLACTVTTSGVFVVG